MKGCMQAGPAAYVRKAGRIAALLVLLMSGLSIAAGCVTGTGMEGAFYLLLPYALGLILDLLLLASVGRLVVTRGRLQTYAYEKMIRRCPYEAGGRALLGFIGLAGFIGAVITKNYRGEGAGAAIYAFSQAAGAVGGFVLLRISRGISWQSTE